jgi:hypothetical protein
MEAHAPVLQRVLVLVEGTLRRAEQGSKTDRYQQCSFSWSKEQQCAYRSLQKLVQGHAQTPDIRRGAILQTLQHLGRWTQNEIEVN